MKTNVKLREQGIFKEVEITGEDKPMITSTMQAKWQRIINIIAELLDVPSGLIMKITESSMEVFLKSENDSNPYVRGGSDKLGKGLYCETVIGQDAELIVDDARKSRDWKDNPDVEIDMIAYYGLPIKWPDETFFGTICVLDSKRNKFSETYRSLMSEFRSSIESDLEILMNNSELEFLANYDLLTTVYNRRKMNDLLKSEFTRYMRYGHTYSVVLFDLDSFKVVNDTYGHDVGDQVLVAFSQAIQQNIREVDEFGRWGGDEFLLICPETNHEGAVQLVDKLIDVTLKKIQMIASEVGISYGLETIDDDVEMPYELIKRADKSLYRMKRKSKSLR